MKIQTLLLTSLLLFGCASLKNSSSKQSLTILSATAQKWHAGHVSGGSGVNYTITLIANSNKLSFDSLHLTDYTSKFAVITGNFNETPIKKGDTITLKASTPKEIKLQLTGNIGYNETLRKPIEFAKLKELYYP